MAIFQVDLQRSPVSQHRFVSFVLLVIAPNTADDPVDIDSLSLILTIRWDYLLDSISP
jgi:hypothetical protein